MGVAQSPRLGASLALLARELGATRKALSLPVERKTTTTIQLTQNSFRHDEQCYLAQRLHVRLYPSRAP